MDPGADAPEPASQPSPPTTVGDPTPPAEHPTPHLPQPQPQPQPQPSSSSSQPSRYESQKRRDWNTFLQYLKNHKPPLTLARCSGAHVIEFLKYLDQFGKTKVHNQACEYFGQPSPPGPCPCPLKQAWGSLDALIGRLRAAYEENGGKPETNPFGAKAVRIYLREVRESQAKARGVPYEKKKRKRSQQSTVTVAEAAGSATAARAAGEGSSAAASAAAEEGEGSGAPPEGGHRSTPAATAPPPPTTSAS